MFSDRKFCTVLIYGAVFSLVFFWSIPVGVISSMITLKRIAQVVPFLEPGELKYDYLLGFKSLSTQVCLVISGEK